ncbi:UNKNOWN [Stylonychia lemnae]|uniref:Uncharacterized protein n=1 Tax=Stylonychia lemnae TaxID=5949 RepID=A0A078AWS2_STYLE|nr:UNKNOWN [Stylonychia lemnae]|eukprot:CDW86501.1 UNKNOWN [Stylonychia lemnae]
MNFTSNLQVNNLFKGLTQSLQAQQSQQAQAIKLEDLINKYTGLGRIEKDVIFNYVKNGESQVKQRKDYITNVIIIFNSFFEYGFLHKSISSSSGKSSSYADEWADGDDSNQLGRVEHYWEYMTVQFTDLDTVRYINFYYEEASNNREKALGWILLALNQKDELQRVVMEIFSCIPILQLYSKQDSYLWANRKEILECIDLVNQKSMYNPCPLLDNYIEFGKKKEEKKVNQNFLAFLENEEDEEQIVIQTSARRPEKQNSPISTQNKSQDGSGSKKDQLSNKSALKQYISQSDGGNNLKDQQEDIIGARFQKQNQQFKQEHDDEQSSVVFDPKNSLNNSKDHEDQASSQSQIFRIKTSRNEVGSFAHSSGGESQINIKQHNYGTVSAVNNNLYQIDRQLERQSNQSSRNEANEFTPRKHTETLIINYDRISLSSMNESNFRQNFNQVSNSHVTIANSRLNLFSNNEILAENNPSKSPSPEQTSKVNFNYDTNISPNNKGWLTIRDNNPFQPVQELEDIFKANLSQKFFINEMPTKDNRINDTSFNTRSVHSVKYNDAFKNKTQREYRDSQYSDQNENQQSIGLEDSRRIIDKILNEENINVPQEFRKQFKMIYKDLSGNKYKQDLKNSELVFFNEYYDKFKILEYTYQKKTIFMKKKDQIVTYIYILTHILEIKRKKYRQYLWVMLKKFTTTKVVWIHLKKALLLFLFGLYLQKMYG